MCRIDYADDEQWCVRPPKDRTARKDHRCDDCGRSIAKGERYTYAAWITDYGLEDVKMCAHCGAAGRWLVKVCGGHLYPGVLEELREHWDDEHELRSNGLAWLVTAGRAKWQRRGELVPVETVAAWVDKALAKVPARALHA